MAPPSSGRWASAMFSSLMLFSMLINPIQATEYLEGTDANGVTRELANDRNPALFTKDFGDCLAGGSIINATRFDAAYYADNMTVLFHFGGASSLQSEAVMMYISVEAYGENRFNLTFNPCNANIYSLCPINASVPITAEAIIPVSQSDVSGIPSIALTIPDFEGSAILRLYSNTTQTEVACYKAVMTNGASFSHPSAVAPVLGVFTVAAMLASFSTIIYGINIPAMRTHYAHSLPVLVVFEVFQSIFFTSALNLDWPSAVAAFWSNFAWSAGLIHTKPLTDSINKFVGQNLGNSSEVGSAGSTVLNNNGGLQLAKQIYGRDTDKFWKLSQRSIDIGRDWAGRLPLLENRAILEARESAANKSLGIGYSWAGGPVAPGLPVPGTWNGFAGPLSDVSIPASDAFLISLVWFLIIFVILMFAAAAFKWATEGMVRIQWLREDRLEIFRSKWLGFMAVFALRILMIAFPTMMILTLYQFTIGGNSGTIAIAAISFLIFFGGGLAIATYACYYRLRYGSFVSSPDRLVFERKKVIGFLPWFSVLRDSKLSDKDRDKTFAGSIPFFRIQHVEKNAERPSVHEDTVWIKRFGWLTARFRRTRWWFFAYWVVYHFIRACFIGGAQNNPHTQVYGLLVIEIIAFIAVVCINPFEGRRNTALAVYMLSISKILSTGICIGFLPSFNLGRIIATVLGIAIIVIQGFLTIATMILIVLGVISSYFSLMRNREDFSPRHWDGMRVKYYGHLEQKATDLPPPPRPVTPVPEEPKEPYFTVNSVRRVPKVEDEQEDEDEEVPEMGADGVHDPAGSNSSLPGPLSSGRSRTRSIRSQMSYGQLPYGARVHRASWSSRDFGNMQMQDIQKPESPFRTPSRTASGSANHTATNSASSSSGAPLVRPPKRTVTGPRPSTPTKATQEAFASQRVGSAKF